MALFLAISVAVATLLLVFWIQRWIKIKNLPPGPTPFPLLGNLDVGDSTMAVDVTRIGKKYGDIFTVYILMTPYIILNSYQVIKELLSSKEYADIFSGRATNYLKTDLFPDNLIFQSFSDGQQYLRQVAMRGVKQYGTSLKKIEAISQNELESFVSKLEKHEGRAVDPMNDITVYVTNIMMLLVCGESFEPEHKMFKIANEVGEDFNYLMNYKVQMILDVVPLSRHLYPPIKKACDRLKQNHKDYTEYVTEMRKTSGRRHPDCLFALLEEELKNGKITENNVKGVSLDMLLAGVLTTAPTIYTALLAMAHFPDIQRRVHDEIVGVVGCDRLPGLDDKPRLHYCMATMLESFRYFTPVPLPGPRTTTRDCTYRGYFIPKDTMVTYNVYQVHHDEFWDKPLHFDPTRFLNDDGTLVDIDDERRQRLLTFGIGKRHCVGETLARVRMFLAFTAILQKFELKEDPQFPLPPADPRTYYMKLITIPPTYKLCFNPRKQSAKD